MKKGNIKHVMVFNPINNWCTNLAFEIVSQKETLHIS